MTTLDKRYPNYLNAMQMGTLETTSTLIKIEDELIIHEIEGTFFDTSIRGLYTELSIKSNEVVLSLITKESNHDVVRTSSTLIGSDLDVDAWIDLYSDLLVDHFFDPYFNAF